MKVLIITRGKLPLPNIKGGAVEYLIQLLIDENEKKWHDDFTVCGSYFEGIDALQRKYAYCRFINVRCESVFFKMESLIRYYINTRIKYIGNCYLSRLLKHISNTMNDYDVLIDENAPDFLPILRNKFHGRLIFHCHNDWLSNEEISVLNNCDEYWAISGFLAKKARNNGVNCKIARLYNGVDLDHYLNIDSNLVKSYQDKYGIGVGDIILLYSGRIVPEKGVLEMIQAFVNAKFDKKVKLLVVGGTFYDDTSKTAYVRRCLEAAKEYESIIFTGYISYDSMPAIYSLADIGIFPSKCEEAFGLSLLEMMASGLPIITTDNGAIPEIVDCRAAYIFSTDNTHSWISNMSRAMNKLVHDSDLREKMGKFSAMLAKNFSSDKYLHEFYRLLYKNV